jgi:hypothetical protein
MQLHINKIASSKNIHMHPDVCLQTTTKQAAKAGRLQNAERDKT